MLYGSISKHWHCHRHRGVHDSDMQTKISRDWQFSPWQCTAFLPVTDMVGVSSELGNTKNKQSKHRTMSLWRKPPLPGQHCSQNGYFWKAPMANSGSFEQIWCLSSALGGGRIKWWGVAEYHICQGCSKMLGEERYYVRSSDGAHCRLSFT